MERRIRVRSEGHYTASGKINAGAGPISLLLAALLLVLIVGLDARSAHAQADEPTPEALRQIGVLLAEKQARTPVQRKIGSQLLLERARRSGGSSLQTLPSLRPLADVAPDGTVLVDLSAEVDASLLQRIERAGGTVVNAHPRFGAVRARLPLDALEEIAAATAVRSIRPADRMITQMINTTEGDVAHRQDVARATFGVDGTGVTSCAMSDSVDALAALQGSGDLPAGVAILPGQSGNPGTSEGTALLEIIHDMAPGADLIFATGSGGTAQMAQNILDLAAAGCDVIVDDVLYLGEGVFQDDIIAQAVETVAATGVFYVTSAGNSGNLDNGTSGVWEGDYVGTALPTPLAGVGLSAHDFGGGANTNEITFDPPVLVTLQWADPLDGATNDLDLFLLDATMTNVLGASTTTQNGTQDPLEAIASAGDDTGNHLVVTLFNGTGQFLHLNTHRGQLDVGTDGQIFGHPAAEGAITVAAVNVATAGGGAFTGGAANPVEPFSSDGPRRIFFNADGSPVVTEGVPNSTVRHKPDVAAADGVSTATPGFNPFFGTSASAPHVAAIATLVKQRFPNFDPFSDDDVLFNSALDIDDPGLDRNSGAGILMSDNLLDNAQDIFADGFESGDAAAWTSQVP